MTLDAEASAAQLLLCLCDILQVSREQRYLALWLLADQFAPTLHSSKHDKRSAVSENQDFQPPLQLFAVACLSIAFEAMATKAKDRQQEMSTQHFHTQASKVLGDSFSVDKLTDAVAIVKNRICISKQLLASDHLYHMHQTINKTGLAIFQAVNLDVCYAILDLLYASDNFRASKPLECGGKLLAAAIIGAAFVITVKPEQIVSLPLLSWLCDLSSYPKEVVKTQTEQILAYVLQ